MGSAASASPPVARTTRDDDLSAHALGQIECGSNNQDTAQIEFGGYSTAGLKSENQDAFAVLQPEASVRKYKGSVATIADGVSCSARSQEASQLSVSNFISDYYSTPDTWPIKDSAARVLNALNSWLYQHGNQGPSHNSELVTTFSSVIIQSHTAHIFHAGDSRVYCYRAGKLEQLSRDHARREANGNVVLTNALGMDTHLEVDYLQHPLEPGDMFLLSTDGVHDFLDDTELTGFLDQNDNSLESLAQRITNTALSKGSDDNLSCLILRLTSLPTEKSAAPPHRTENYVIPPILEPGRHLDGFEVLEKLPGNEYYHSYLVSADNEHTTRVLKAPRADYAENSDYLESFVREQWIGQRLDHPRVSRIYPRPPGSPFIYNLYAYTPSQDLRQWMRDNPDPAIATVRDIVEQIASGLRAFQRQGMLQRDLSPGNVRIDKHSRVQLIDFGTLQVNGLDDIKPLNLDDTKSAYAAPEYLLGQSTASRSDIYSLGVLAYEMLCGELPYKNQPQGKSRSGSVRNRRYRSARLARPDLPVWIDAALKKATASSPANRYEALSELCHDMRHPNQSLVNKLENAPLMERHPLLVWQVFSLFLLLSLIWVAV